MESVRHTYDARLISHLTCQSYRGDTNIWNQMGQCTTPTMQFSCYSYSHRNKMDQCITHLMLYLRLWSIDRGNSNMEFESHGLVHNTYAVAQLLPDFGQLRQHTISNTYNYFERWGLIVRHCVRAHS